MATPETIVSQLLGDPPKADTPEPEPKEPAQEPTQQQPSQAATTETPEPDGPVKLSDLARKLDMDPTEFFAAVNSDGLSANDAFKAAKEAGSLNADRETFETERNTLRLEKSAALAEISDYVALLPEGAVSKEARQQLQAAKGVVLEREQALLLAAVPEWKDPAQKQADVESMTAYIAQFGLTAADLGAISDHRQMLLLRHVARQQTRLNELLAGADKPKPKGVKKASQGKESDSGGKSIDITAMVKSARDAR